MCWDLTSLQCRHISLRAVFLRVPHTPLLRVGEENFSSLLLLGSALHLKCLWVAHPSLSRVGEGTYSPCKACLLVLC